MAGIQFYLEMIDDDRTRPPDDLIDRIVVNINPIPTISMSIHHNRTGVYGLGHMSLTFDVNCAQNFSGEFCTPQLLMNNTTQNQTVEENGSVDVARIVAPTLVFTLIIVLFVALVTAVMFLAVKLRRAKRGQHSAPASTSIRYNSLHHSLLYRGRTPEPNTAMGYEVQVQRTYHPIPEISVTSEHTGSLNYDYATPYSPATFPDMDSTILSKHKEIEYWHPSNKEEELLEEIHKLKLTLFEESELEIRHFIAAGTFGEVFRAVWHNNSEAEHGQVEVAVKSLKKGADDMERVQFLQEAVIMGQFHHPYILQIFGIMANSEKNFIVGEYMPRGSLLHHLRNLQPNNFDELELKSELLCYSRQIANGMEYLGLRKYIHRDLAARNVLLSRENICKIADFGLSRDLQSEGFYLSHGGKIPVKWSSPEALNYHLYSSASDMWSYGIVLYEIWSLGGKPYHKLTNDQVSDFISSGSRLPPPPGCPRLIYEIMIQSWNSDADSRPLFIDVIQALNRPEFKLLKWSPQDVNAYNEESRTLGAPMHTGKLLFTELQQTYTQ